MQQLLRAQWEELEGKEAVTFLRALPGFGSLPLSVYERPGSMHPLVYELPGPLSLSRMSCLGNGREGVPEGNG